MPRVLLVGRADTVGPSLERAPLPPDTEVETCPGNIEAMHRLRARAYDVVVTQPSTSVQDSLPVARDLQEARPGLRVIVLASAAAPNEIIEALRAQVYACFTQPFDYPEIASVVVQALRETNWRHSIEVVSGMPHWMTLRVSCGLMTADRLVRFMTEYRSDMPEAERDLLMTAFREMLLNAMEHGAGFDSDKVIEVTAARTARALVYHFRDPGSGFDRDDLAHAASSPDPEAVVASALRRAEMGLRPGGFGMLIARQVADELVYNESGNEVLMIKHLDV